MKRLNLVLFGVLLLNFSVFAQIGDATQRGKATHEMDSRGFFAAHSSFPLGSTIKVVNTATGEAINAVVNGRIRASATRIVDLSNDAWNALGLTDDTLVMIVYASVTVIRPNSAASEPEAENPEPETENPELAAENPEPTAIIADPIVELTEKILEIQEKLAELTEKLAQIQEREARIAEREAELAEKKMEEAARLKTAQPLYQILVLDRRNCEANSDIGDSQDIKLLYKFRHGADGYLIVVYASYNNEPVFPKMPDNSRIVLNYMAANLALIIEYTDSDLFRRHISAQDIITHLQKTILATGNR